VPNVHGQKYFKGLNAHETEQKSTFGLTGGKSGRTKIWDNEMDVFQPDLRRTADNLGLFVRFMRPQIMPVYRYRWFAIRTFL
jgi:hypothetical protein